MFNLFRHACILPGLLFCLIASAQNLREVPPNQRDAMFYYAEAELIGSDQPKILMISSYIYQYIYEYPAYNVYDDRPRTADDWRLTVTNTVSRKREKIIKDEHYIRAENPYNQVKMKYQQVQWASWNKSWAIGNNNIDNYNTYYSTREYCIAARKDIIERYRKKNYIIIQFNILDVAEEDYFKLDLDRIEKLSSLEYPEYYPGKLKELAWPYYQRTTGTTTTTKTTEPESGVCSGYRSYVRIEYDKAKKAGNAAAWEKVVDACNYYFTYCGRNDTYVNGVYNEANAGIEKANYNAGLAVLMLMGARSEISGSFSFKDAGTAQGTSLSKPIEFYSHQEVRATFVHGGKHLKFTLSPLAFTWLYLPTHTKYDPASGAQLERGDWGATRFYTPSLGLVYSFFGKKQKSNLGRSFEVPLSVQYIFLWSPYNKLVNDNHYEGESMFKEYFNTSRYMARATLGMEYFFGKGLGIGISAGMNYVDIKPVTTVLTDDVNGYGRDFKLEMDQLKQFYPVAEVKLIIRNNAY